MKKILYIGFLFLVACEVEPDLNIPEVQGEVVVEGWIEQGRGAEVILTLTAPFFTTIDSSNIRDYALTRAKVRVYTDTDEEVLTLGPNKKYFPPFVYYSTRLKGETGKTYHLEVTYQGDTITAVTSIPEVTPIDSAWFEVEPGIDTAGRIWIKFTDNGASEDYYRVLTRRVGKDPLFLSTLTSVFSDETINGKTVEFGFTHGITSLTEADQDRYFKAGDVVIIRLSRMDRQHFEFWNTLQAQVISSANPFSTANARIKSNITNGLGVWGGYASSYDTIPIDSSMVFK
jgi:hypothetical protein